MPTIWIRQGRCRGPQGAATPTSWWVHSVLDAAHREGGSVYEVWALVERALIGWAGSCAMLVSTDDKGMKWARPRAVAQAAQVLGFMVS